MLEKLNKSYDNLDFNSTKILTDYFKPEIDVSYLDECRLFGKNIDIFDIFESIFISQIEEILSRDEDINIFC